LLRGTYFFADFCSAEIWSLRYDGLNISEFQDCTNELDPGHGLDIRLIDSFGEDADGNLYIVDQIDGEIFRITTKMQFVTTQIIAGETATFRIRGATPSTEVFFVYSLAGLGDVNIPQLNIHLGIANPRLIGHQKTNDLGSAVLKRTIPSNTAGQTIWLQGAENGNTSNVLRRTIQ